ncbi:MAG: EamA family transporter [Gemmatimonadota bacterium]
MTWVFLALGVAVFYALQGAWTKHVAGRLPRDVITWSIFGFALPLAAAYLAARGLPASIEPRFWFVAAFNITLYVVTYRLYVRALEMSEISLIFPLLALTPALLVPVEWLLLREAPGPAGLVGIGLVVLGVYTLNVDARVSDPLAPFKAIGRDPGARRMLAVACIWSVTASVDRIAVHAASPAFYGLTVVGSLSLILLPAAVRASGGVTSLFGRPKWRLMVVQGFLFATMYLLHMEAVRLTLAANVVTFKRAGTLLAVWLGAAVFGEKAAGYRAGGTIMILSGVALLVLS